MSSSRRVRSPLRKSTKRKYASLTYGALALTDTVLASRPSTRARKLRAFTKPLLMPALTTSFMTATPNRSDRLKHGTVAAQAFSWAGDVALLGSSERAFLTGVGSFFAAHAAYIAALRSAGSHTSSRSLSRPGPLLALAVWGAATPVLATAAGNKDKKLKLPVAAYVTILASMFATSTLLDSARPKAGQRRIVAGTTLFLVSDSILATREFIIKSQSPKLDAAVMATYTAGQWLIAEGVAQS
jgi:uncharacterized membrane protein YhhN